MSAAVARKVGRPRLRRPVSRRGVASVLAMMFLVIFGSLAAAMAVVTQGNLRTAHSHKQVSRAMSAAETGLVFAGRRLGDEATRFVVKKGVVDTDYAQDLWLGTYSGPIEGDVIVLDPNGYTTTTPPTGIMHAVRDAHEADDHDLIIEAGDSSLPSIDSYGTVLTRPIALTTETDAPYFRLRYELLANEPMIRVTSIGYDGDVRRTLQMDFRLEKKIEYAVISPNRVMIGKNVRVEGPLGTRYGIVAGELDPENGDPLVMRSDFYYLDDDLDDDLDVLFSQLQDYDVDGDGRLRPDHPAEKQGLTGHSELIDYDGDEYVDDFDLFLAHFDSNGDHMVAYDASLAAAAGVGSVSVEFSGIDDQLARLIDEASPDRDGDGVVTFSDRQLGYRDGVFDANDLYAKVHGRVRFAVARDDWEAAHGDAYQSIVHGPLRVGIDVAPVGFEVSDEELRELSTAMFNDSQSWFDTESQTGMAFADQVAAQTGAGGTYTAPGDGTWESVPFGSPGAYDYYQRPIYEDMTFTNVRIPLGTNALFRDCKFIGVTFIETTEGCEHENWNYAGARTRTEISPGVFVYPLSFAGLEADVDGSSEPDTKPFSNNIRFSDCTFIGSVAGNKPNEYTHWRNKAQFTGTTRFYLDSTDPDLLAQPDASTLVADINSLDPDDVDQLSRSSILLPGWSVDVGNFTNEVAVNPEDTPKVKLKGTIVAGIMDVRGTADVHGTLLMTFRPAEGTGPLYYGGLTDAFNTTIGYFGPDDGDSEGSNPASGDFDGFGEITLRYDPNANLPDGIPWPVRIVAEPVTYVEGGD